MNIRITSQVSVPIEEVDISAIRARGPGGQHVNKASTAVQLRFDIRASSLPQAWKARLLTLRDRRITADGMIVITAGEHRSQPRNREAALLRLAQIIGRAARPPKPRVPTRPPRASRQRRLEEKRRRGSVKSLRGRVRD